MAEEVRALVLLSDESKTRWDARRAERRLEEAQILTDNGMLDETKRIEIEERFERHAIAVKARAQKVEKQGNKQTAIALLAEFEGKLRVHEKALARAEKIVTRESRITSAGMPVPGISLTAAPVEEMEVFLDTTISEEAVGAVDYEKKDKEEASESPLAHKVRKQVDKIVQARLSVEAEVEKEELDELATTTKSETKNEKEDKKQDAEDHSPILEM